MAINQYNGTTLTLCCVLLRRGAYKCPSQFLVLFTVDADRPDILITPYYELFQMGAKLTQQNFMNILPRHQPECDDLTQVLFSHNIACFRSCPNFGKNNSSLRRLSGSTT